MAVGSAIIAGLGLAYSVYAGETGAQRSRKGLRRQQTAQRQATTSALKTSRDADQANRAAANVPDISQILFGEQGGSIETLLTGPEGAASKKVLGRKTSLGGGA